MLFKRCSATAKTLVCYQHTVLVTNPKHSTIQAAVKKINFILPRSSTNSYKL